METCMFCSQIIQCTPIDLRDAYSVDCPFCGHYDFTRIAQTNIRNSQLSLRQRANISGWLLENCDFEISTKNFEMLKRLTTPSFHERADKLLIFLESQTSYAGEFIKRNDNWISHSWCICREELEEVLLFLVSTKRIIHSPVQSVKIEPNGWEHLENLKAINIQSDQCFVAMWFSDELNNIYNDVISAGIQEAGYTPHRVDQREHNEKIDDEIIAQIKRSRFLLADFTGHRGGVYYEAGFAKGLNLEVIWSCREDYLENLHFDIRQYNCIVWSQNNLENFKNRIKNRIGATVGFRF